MEMSEKVDEIKDYFKLKDFSHVVTRVFTKFKSETIAREFNLRELLLFIQKEMIPTELSKTEELHESISINSLTKHRSSFNDLNQIVVNPGTADFNYVGEICYKDLRNLDEDINPHLEPSIIVRKHVVIFLLEPLRVLISSTHLMIIVPQGADEILSILDDQMSLIFNQYNSTDKSIDKLPSSVNNSVFGDLKLSKIVSESSFEIKAYEAIIAVVIIYEESEYTVLKRKALDLISHFQGSSIIPIEYQEAMRELKNEIVTKLNKIESHLRWLEDLLNDDDKMALMNLTKLADQPKLYTFPLSPEILKSHVEIEIVLESHLRSYYSLLSKLNSIKNQLNSSEDMMKMKLDTTRNELLKTNMILTIISTNLTLGGFIAGIFGMNLDNTVYLQQAHNGFLIVTVATSGLVVLGIIFTILFFRYYKILPS